MRKEIVLVFCLLVAAVFCDQHEGHNHADHNHADHNHGGPGHGHGDHDHGSHSHGGHDHGGHSHGEHGHEDHGNVVRDCAAHLQAGERESGVKRIKPEGCHHAIDVLCDMETDGGGWTVIQKRGDYGNPADYFYRTWNDYKNGFGDLEKEIWIGNYHINHLTEQGNYELRIDMKSITDEDTHVRYETFKVDNETSNYALHVGNLVEGNAANSLSTANGNGFTTSDRDHDHSTDNCAALAKGAWWYNDCGNANLNGPHMENQEGDLTQSIYWFNNEGNPVLLKNVKMMVRPKPSITE